MDSVSISMYQILTLLILPSVTVTYSLSLTKIALPYSLMPLNIPSWRTSFKVISKILTGSLMKTKDCLYLSKDSSLFFKAVRRLQISFFENSATFILFSENLLRQVEP